MGKPSSRLDTSISIYIFTKQPPRPIQLKAEKMMNSNNKDTFVNRKSSEYWEGEEHPLRSGVQPSVPTWADEKRVVTNHSGYGYKGSENFEHEDNGSLMNYSGCVDDTWTAIAEHEDWQEGYDY